MFKKLAVGAALLVVGAGLLFGTRATTYVQTAWNRVTGAVQDAVPVEFELDRARQMLENAGPAIEKQQRLVVEQEVKLERMAEEIAKLEDNLDTEKLAVLKLRDQLGKKLASYEIAGRSYSQDDLRAELNHRFETFKRNEELLDTRQEEYQARADRLIAAKDKVQAMVRDQDSLALQIEKLEAKLEAIKAKKVRDELKIDDSEIGEIRQVLERLEDKLEVEERIVESNGKPVSRVPVEEIVPSDLETQIDQHFQSETPRGTEL